MTIEEARDIINKFNEMKKYGVNPEIYEDYKKAVDVRRKNNAKQSDDEKLKRTSKQIDSELLALSRMHNKHVAERFSLEGKIDDYKESLKTVSGLQTKKLLEKTIEEKESEYEKITKDIEAIEAKIRIKTNGTIFELDKYLKDKGQLDSESLYGKILGDVNGELKKREAMETVRDIDNDIQVLQEAFSMSSEETKDILSKRLHQLKERRRKLIEKFNLTEEDLAKEETPVEETPIETTEAEETPAEETEATAETREETPVEETPAEATAEETEDEFEADIDAATAAIAPEERPKRVTKIAKAGAKLLASIKNNKKKIAISVAAVATVAGLVAVTAFAPGLGTILVGGTAVALAYDQFNKGRKGK